MKFFKPEDFVTDDISASAAAARANAKLEREGKVFWGSVDEHESYFHIEKDDVDTHKALLINIEPIEETMKLEEKGIITVGETGYYSVNGTMHFFEKGQKIQKVDWKTKQLCTHPAEKVKAFLGSENGKNGFQCECGARVTPKTFEVCE